MAILGAVGAAIALEQYFASPNLVRVSPTRVDDNPVVGADFYGILALLTAYMALYGKSRWLWPFYALFLLTILLSGSRGPSLAIIIASLILILGKSHNKAELKRKMIATVLALVAVAAIIFLTDPEMVEYAFTRKDNHRYEIWWKALGWIQESPIFGHGIDADFRSNFDADTVKKINPYNAHNFVLAQLYYGGAIGLLCA